MRNSVKENQFKGIYKGYYYAVIPFNMAIPKAMFLSEDEAIRYSCDEQAIHKVPLRDSLFRQALNRC